MIENMKHIRKEIFIFMISFQSLTF